MNFEFGEEQELLREQARGFLANHCPPTAVRAVLDGDADHDAQLWQKIVEMGSVSYTHLTLPTKA